MIVSQFNVLIDKSLSAIADPVVSKLLIWINLLRSMPHSRQVFPRGRYVNECTTDNGGCQDRCCSTIGSYYCKCQAGQKLEEDGRGCEDVLKMVWNSQTFSGIFEQA
ncbi:Tolloid-Like Protein 2 [Manis pentadactyla]|nr:Tolloid-Like Protein 2 [Manis pentadactyla]